ncbi:MAG TPA: MBOAT family protein [Bacteroidetes bacterium]|nr:MBOAT family protein [Bacteroidota bacterium]
MVFSSITFLLYFLPVFLVCYHLVGKRYKNAVILLSSIFFYAWGAPKFVFILLASTYLDFYLVKWMHETEASKKKKLLLALSIFINVGLLAFFKYANFFVENINLFFAQIGAAPIKWVEIALPIGISFYTFQTLTYSIDVYRKVHEPLKKVSDYVLYIIMFPQLIAGPIVRFNEIADQITGRNETAFDKLSGFYRFCIGLAKKVLIANVMGKTADKLIGLSPGDMDATTAWVGIAAYTFQIYFDFSGYSDMAIGLGKMMGFKFPENFNNPYVSKSITEFWRRWHITLGTWMRDYLYIPLGGSRVSSAARLYFNLWVVFLISGLWHGASWNFVLWGAFHGFFLVLERMFLLKAYKKLGAAISLVVTFFITVCGWVIFRVEDMTLMKTYFAKMFGFEFSGLMSVVDKEFAFVFVLAFLLSFFVVFPKGQQMQNVFYLPKNKPGNIWAMFVFSIILFVFSLAAISASGFNPFIYFRF